MEQPAYFRMEQGYARFHLEGETTLPEGVKLVSGAIVHARERQIRKLLVNVTKISGVAPPTPAERYNLAERWARDARGAVKVALVIPEAMLDPGRLVLTVARNRGMVTDAFTDEGAALAWLLRPSAG